MANESLTPAPQLVRRRLNEGASPVVGKHYPTGRIAKWMSRFSFIFVLVSILPLFALTIVIAFTYPNTEFSQNDFLLTRYAPVDNAKKLSDHVAEWKETVSTINATAQCVTDFGTPQRLPVYTIEVRAYVDLTKLGPSDPYVHPSASRGNMLSSTNYAIMQDLERKVYALANFKQICYISSCRDNGWNKSSGIPECAPMSSLSGYLYPGDLRYTLPSGVQMYTKTGLSGKYQAPYERMIARIMTNPKSTWFVDPSFSRTRPMAVAARFQVVFGAPAYLNNGRQSTRRQFVMKAREIAVQLASWVEDANRATSYMRVSAGGEIMHGGLLQDALNDEWYYLLAAVLIVIVILIVRTYSFFLTATITIALALTYTASIAIYSTANDKSVPFLTSTSIFLVTGLALHVSMSIQDCFKASGSMATSGRRNNLTVAQRISYTFRHACSSASLTLIITLIMFAGCIVAPYSGVQEFAKILVIEVSILLYLAWTYFMGIVVLYHRYFSDADRLKQRQREILERQADDVSEAFGRRHPTLVNYLRDQEHNIDDGEAIYSEDMKAFAENQKSRKRNVANTRSLDKILGRIISQMGIGRSAQISAGFTSAVFTDNINNRRYDGAQRQMVQVNAFDEAAFADSSALASRPLALSYASPRIVPLTEILHIPRPVLFTHPDEIMATLREDERRHHESTGEAIYSSSSDSDETNEIQIGNSTTNAGSRPHCLRQNNWFVDFRSRRDASTSHSAGRGGAKSGASDPQADARALQDSRSHMSRFVDHWHEAARRLGIRQGPSKTSKTLSSIAAFSVHSLVRSTDYSKVIACATRFPKSSSATRANSPQSIPPSLPEGTAYSSPTTLATAHSATRIGLLERYALRFREKEPPRRRFGVFGKRIGETRAEKDARVLAKVADTDRISWVENKVAHLYVPFLNKGRWFFVGVTIALVIAFSVVASRATYESGSVQVTTNALLQRYEAANVHFLETSPTCVDCAAYYQPVDAYYSSNSRDRSVCASDSQNYYADQCGACLGNEASCMTCVRNNSAGFLLDSCGECRVTNSTACYANPCDSLAVCGVCEFMNRLAPVPGIYTGGLSACDVSCDSKTCAYCDPYTGQCFSDTCAGMGTLVGRFCACQTASGRSGKYCHVEAACSYAGRIEPSVSTTTCSCIGNFVGPRCQFCSCKNGGTCHLDTGACVCPSGFSGVRCEKCSPFCETCSSNWTASQYSTRLCVPQFCSPGNVVSGTVCPECEYKLSRIADETEESCWIKSGTYWSADGNCYKERAASGPLTCRSCKGFWEGPGCRSCYLGMFCKDDGSAVACDGNIYTAAQRSLVPRIDACGFCTRGRATSCSRPNKCLGPDCSQKWVDASVTVYPKDGYPTPQDTQLLTRLREACRGIARQVPINGVCLPLAFPGSSLTGTALSDFVIGSSTPEDIGFDAFGNFKFMRVRIQTSATETAQAKHYDAFFKTLQRDLERSVDAKVFDVRVSSQEWTQALSQLAVSTTLKFLVFLGISITLAAIFAITLSLRLALIAIVCIGGCSACTLGVIVAAGWELNALIMCCFPGLFAIPLCHISHMALHYMDRLEEDQLQLFARELTTKEAVRTMMSRTLMTVVGACAASGIVCIPTAFSKVHAMYVVAMVMLISHLWSLLFACVLFPACLCALGPVTATPHQLLSMLVLLLCLAPIVGVTLSSNMVDPSSGLLIF